MPKQPFLLYSDRSLKGFYHFNTAPASVAITGHMYHRLFDIADSLHSLHWFLYNSLEHDKKAEQFKVPSNWTRAVNDDLQVVNPYIYNLCVFHSVPELTACALELTDVGQNSDFAAIMHAGNSTTINPRAVIIWCNRDTDPTFIPIFTCHYEPLQYPLLFPHGTPGWGLTRTASGQYKNMLPLTATVVPFPLAHRCSLPHLQMAHVRIFVRYVFTC